MQNLTQDSRCLSQKFKPGTSWALRSQTLLPWGKGALVLLGQETVWTPWDGKAKVLFLWSTSIHIPYVTTQCTCCFHCLTCVSLQLLDHLFRLQVPNVHKVVFWTRDNPLHQKDKPYKSGSAKHRYQWHRLQEFCTYLPSCHWEICKDAVFLIAVSSVSLEALALAVVPQFQCVVQCGCQNILSIWWELHKWYRRIVVIY